MATREHLPSVEMINFEGLYTKQNPETLTVTQLRECKNGDFFREYGSLSKLRGNKLVLSGIYTESAATKGIYWGAFYKNQELSGAITRQTLIGAGTTLQKVEDDGTLTELLTGEPDSLYRTSDELDRWLYITSQDPLSVGKRGQMAKYDGTRITQWGLTAPGSQETVVESFDDSSIFALSNATVADSTLPAFQDTATAMTKGAASTSAYIENLNSGTISAFNNIIEDRAQIYLYIPREDYRKLASSGRAVSVYFADGATLGSSYYRYDFQIGRLGEGWNLLIMDFSTFPSGDFGTTVGTPDDDAIISYRYEVITNNASDTLTVYWDTLASLDQGAPVPTFSGAGGTVFPNSSSEQIWKYKTTFVDDAGFESNAGPVSVDADNTTGGIGYSTVNLATVPVSSNAAVIQRNLYRTVAGGSTYLFLGTINDNVTTTFADTTSDTSLGASQPPVIGDLIFDNSPPPSGGITVIWKRTAFIAGDPLNPNVLAFSRYDFPEAFPLVNAIEFDERITGLMKTYLGLVIATETAYWRIIGDNPDYTTDQVIQGFGCIGPRGVGTARETGWVTDRDGMRLYNLQETMKISEVIRDRVDGFYKGALEDSHTEHSKKNNAVLWFTKDSSGVFSDIYMYQYMIDDVRRGWYSQVIPNPTTFDIQHTWEIEDSVGEPKYYAGASDGMVYELMADDSLNWVNASGQSRAITMEVQTAFMRLGALPEVLELEQNSGRVTPRLLELRIKEASGLAHEWTLLVETSDSADESATVRDSQTITFSFPANVSLLRLSPKNLISGEYVRLTLTNAQKDKDLQIMGIKVYYHVRPGQFMVTDVAGGQN